MISHSASGRVGFWDGSSMSQLATLIRAATHYPPSMSQLATAIRAATHILETQLTVTSYKLYFGPHPIRVQRTTHSTSGKTVCQVITKGAGEHVASIKEALSPLTWNPEMKWQLRLNEWPSNVHTPTSKSPLHFRKLELTEGENVFACHVTNSHFLLNLPFIYIQLGYNTFPLTVTWTFLVCCIDTESTITHLASVLAHFAILKSI